MSILCRAVGKGCLRRSETVETGESVNATRESNMAKKKKGWPNFYPSGKKVSAKTRKKYKSCLKKVKSKQRNVNPYAVCTSSVRYHRKKKNR